MNHPSHEEWMDFLYGEISADRKRACQSHLATCKECGSLLKQWRGTVAALDGWKLTRNRAKPTPFVPLLRWATAAMVMLGIGIGSGFWAARNRQMDSLRAALVPMIQREILHQLQQQWKTEFAAMRLDLSNNVDKASETVLAASRQDMIRIGNELAREIKTARVEDRDTFRTWLAGLQQQHESDVAWLRKDLETVAVQADGQLQSTRHKLGQLILASVVSPK